MNRTFISVEEVSSSPPWQKRLRPIDRVFLQPRTPASAALCPGGHLCTDPTASLWHRLDFGGSPSESGGREGNSECAGVPWLPSEDWFYPWAKSKIPGGVGGGGAEDGSLYPRHWPISKRRRNHFSRALAPVFMKWGSCRRHQKEESPGPGTVITVHVKVLPRFKEHTEWRCAGPGVTQPRVCAADWRGHGVNYSWWPGVHQPCGKCQSKKLNCDQAGGKKVKRCLHFYPLQT